MLDIRVNVANMSAETHSGGKAINICIEAVLAVKLIIREVAGHDERLAHGVLKTIQDEIGKQTVEEIVAELDAALEEARGEHGKLS